MWKLCHKIRTGRVRSLIAFFFCIEVSNNLKPPPTFPPCTVLRATNSSIRHLINLQCTIKSVWNLRNHKVQSFQVGTNIYFLYIIYTYCLVSKRLTSYMYKRGIPWSSIWFGSEKGSPSHWKYSDSRFILYVKNTWNRNPFQYWPRFLLFVL